jgi:hypothetical protein
MGVRWRLAARSDAKPSPLPVAKDQPGLEGASDESANILMANAGVEPVELLISQVAGGEKTANQQVEQTENQMLGKVIRSSKKTK